MQFNTGNWRRRRGAAAALVRRRVEWRDQEEW